MTVTAVLGHGEVTVEDTVMKVDGVDGEDTVVAGVVGAADSEEEGVEVASEGIGDRLK